MNTDMNDAMEQIIERMCKDDVETPELPEDIRYRLLYVTKRVELLAGCVCQYADGHRTIFDVYCRGIDVAVGIIRFLFTLEEDKAKEQN